MLYLCYKHFTPVNALRTDALPSNQILKNHQNKQKRSTVVEILALKKNPHNHTSIPNILTYFEVRKTWLPSCKQTLLTKSTISDILFCLYF